MKELNNFREFLNETKFKVGDKVTMNNGGPEMEIIRHRRMFGSDLNAYSVKKADGEEMEYDEKQLRLAEGNLLKESAPGYDTRGFGGALPTLESVKAAYEAKQDVEEGEGYKEYEDGVEKEKLAKDGDLKEGVWSVLPDRIPEFIKLIEKIKDEYHGVVGSDSVYDGLDRAIMAAEELLNMELKEE